MERRRIGSRWTGSVVRIGVRAAILALLLAGGTILHAQQRGGTLIFTVPSSDLPSMDGHQETSFAVIQPIAPHYNLLVRVDPTDPRGVRLEGDLAEGWTLSADRRTYTFRLRPGVRFHDGSPLNARDVVASFRHLISPPEGVVSPRRSNFMMVDSVTAPHDRTVVFRLKFATSAFLPVIATPFHWIYKAELLAQDPNWYRTHVMGTGPFRFKEQTPGTNWIGVRNDDYFRKGLPYLDRYEAIFTTKETIEVQAMRGGRSLFQFRGFSPTARDDLKRALGNDIQVQESPADCALFVVPNSFKKPFDDVRVRQALNLAIDRWGGSAFLSKTAVVKTVGGFVFPGHPLALSDRELEQLPGFSRDIEASRAEARRLLKAAGVPEGFRFRLNNRNSDQPYKIVGTWLIDQWRRIGLNVEQDVRPIGPFFQVLRADPPQYDVTVDFVCNAVVNPAVEIGKFISKDKSDSNFGHYVDRHLDQLYEQQIREPDPARQREIVKEFQGYLARQSLYITTLWWQRILVGSSRVQGWQNPQLEAAWLKP